MSDEKLIRHTNLKRIAASRGLTAKDLATQVGGHESLWYGLLQGVRPFGEKIARRIEEKLGLSRYELDEDRNNETGYVKLDQAERELIASYRKLSVEARQVDHELAKFGERRLEAYQLLLDWLENELPVLLAEEASPSAPSAERPTITRAKHQKKSA